LNQENTVQKPPEPALELAKGKSKGEKLFDRAVYGGLAGAVTFAITVPVTYLLKYHWKVKPHFDAAVDGLHRGMTKVFPAMGRKTADTALTTLALMQGGNLMLLPIAWAEKHKAKIVSGLNVMLGDKTPPEQIEQAPQQTMWSLVQSRLMAFGAVFATLKGAEAVIPKTLNTLEDEVGTQMCKLLEKPVARMGPVIENGKLTTGMVPTKTYAFGKIGALDVFATAAAATLLYVGGHFFARKQAEKKAVRAESKTAKRLEAPVMLDEAPKANLTQVAGEKQYQGVVASATREAQLS